MEDLYFNIAEKPTYSELGKTVLIVVKEADNVQDNIDLLQNIIKALKLSFNDDCHLISIHNDIHISSIMNHFNKIIVFGIQSSQLELNFSYQNYRPINLENKIILFSEPLAELKKSGDKKTTLWKALQLMFDIVKN